MNKKMPEKVFAAIDEYVKRHREGENPTIEEYIKQFPEWREEFEDVRFTCNVFQAADTSQSILSEHSMDKIFRAVLPHFEKNVQKPLWEKLKDTVRLVISAVSGQIEVYPKEAWVVASSIALSVARGEVESVSAMQVGERYRLTEGPLEGTEIEKTSANRLAVYLNRRPRGAKLRLIDEHGQPINLTVVHELDRRGRAVFDISNLTEDIAFRIVLEEDDDTKTDKD